MQSRHIGRFGIVQRFSNLLQILEQQFLVHFIDQEGVFFFKLTPILATDRVTVNLKFALVTMPSFSVGNQVDAPNDGARREMQFHSLLLVDFIPHVVRAFFDEEHFEDFVELLNHILAFVVMPWFQALQEVDDEVLEVGIVPFEVAVGLVQVLWNREEFLECLNEFFEEKLSQDFKFLIGTELIVVSQIFISTNTRSSIMSPGVPEMLFNFLLELHLDISFVIGL